MNNETLPTTNPAEAVVEALIFAEPFVPLPVGVQGHEEWAQRRHCKKLARRLGYSVKRGPGYSTLEAILKAIDKKPTLKYVVMVDRESQLAQHPDALRLFEEAIGIKGVPMELTDCYGWLNKAKISSVKSIDRIFNRLSKDVWDLQ